MDDAAIVERAYRGTALCARVFAASGGSHEIAPGVTAHLAPVAPERAVANAVTYTDPDALIESIPAIEAFYDDAGIIAWTVWVPHSHTRVADALAAAGNVHDSEPLAMAFEIASLERPGPGALENWTTEVAAAVLGPINDRAYGYDGSFTRLLDGLELGPEFTLYAAVAGGEPIATTIIADAGTDAHVSLVATLPEHRGKGVASALIGHALADARERGMETSSLVATKLGAPIYERLGYRSAGAIDMWERRRKS